MRPSDPTAPISLVPRAEVSRRDALRLIAAGVAALEAGCLSRAGDEEIVPYAIDPEDRAASARVRYATALVVDGFATGAIVETADGRPIKLDGNPAHPANLGGSTPWMQARVLDLWDPQRARAASIAGAPADRAAIDAALRALPAGPLWLVLPPVSSPSIVAMLARVRAAQAQAGREVHVVYDAPLDHRDAYRGHALAFGRPLEQQLDLARADVVVALDADPLAAMPMSPAWARAAAARRTPDRRMSRLWVAEPVPTPTGTIADERLPAAARDVAAVAVALAASIAAGGGSIATLPPALVARAGERLGPARAWVDRLAADLLAHRGAGAIVVGDRQPAAVHALARWIEAACGDHGGPVAFSEPAIAEPLGGDSLASLARALATGQVGALVVLDVDPVRTAPPALALEAAFARAPFSLCLAAYPSRTARACRAFAPLAHELETWGDGRAWDGTLSIAQPACRPRFDVLAPLDVLAVLAGDGRDARAIVRDQHRGLDDAAWTDALRAGVVAGSRAPRIAPAPLPAAFPAELSDGLATALAAGGAGTLEVALAASPQLRDGRFAANAWLQELPHPITKQTWGNGALMSRATAHALHVGDGELLLVETDAGAAALPAVLVDGAADGSITIEVGHGARDRALPIADRVGADAYPLRTGDSLLATGRAHRTGGVGRVIRTQTTMTEHGRETTPLATLAGFLAAPDLTAHLRGDPPSMLPARAREGVQWGMSIDTSSCTGCGACMIACQAENNVPSVGPDDVARGRHMGWLRVDRYQHAGGVAVNQPVPCQHCEDAPCEYVCPVEATVHSPDGLNEQVYNRCVGTRFCSNNCPYKVRRFNWFAYERRGSDALQYNPDVTVRSRGVMEKCTYCVQRIRRAEQTALVEDREPAPGEVVTACQQACPTAAIQFGRLDEEGTAFAAMRRDPRRFDLLHDLGARPRTQYLAAIRNPGPRR